MFSGKKKTGQPEAERYTEKVDSRLEMSLQCETVAISATWAV